MASPPSGLVSPQLAEAALGKERRKRTTEGKALSSASLPPPFPLTQSGGGPKGRARDREEEMGFWPRPDMAEEKRGLWGLREEHFSNREGKGKVVSLARSDFLGKQFMSRESISRRGRGKASGRGRG